AHLEGGDRLSGLGDHRLLARDQAEIIGRGFDLLAVVDAFADAHIDDDLLDHRNLPAALVAELIRQLLARTLFERGLERWCAACLPPSRPRWLRRGFPLAGFLALLGPRSLVRCLRLLGLGFGFGVSHRSLLPNAWPPAPCVDCRLRPRT